MSAIGFGDELVRDYLLFRGFLTALKAFDSEVKADKDRGFRPDRIVEHLSSCIINLDLNALRESWAHLDQRFFSRLEHSFLGTAKKLETALLRMYLVTCVSSGRQDKLLDFFDKMTTDLQGQAEWKDWFALPFIKNADEHPTYAAFFSRQWQDTMLLSLHNFISVVFQSAAMPTLLCYEEDLIKFQHLSEENEMLKKKLAALQAGESVDFSKMSQQDSGGLRTPSELMDDFYVIAQETPPEYSGRSIKTLIRNISGGLPTSPVLSRRTTESRKTEESSNSLKSTKAKPRSPSVPPQSSLSVFESSRPKKDSPETARSVSQDEGQSLLVKAEKKPVVAHSISTPSPIHSMKEETMSGFIILSCEKYSEHNSLITHCKFNCSGTSVASSDMDGGVIKIWNAIPSISTLSTIMSKTSVLSLDWDRKRERLLLYGGTTGVVRLYDTKERRVLKEISTDNGSNSNQSKVICICCNPVGTNFVTSTCINEGRPTLSLGYEDFSYEIFAATIALVACVSGKGYNVGGGMGGLGGGMGGMGGLGGGMGGMGGLGGGMGGMSGLGGGMGGGLGGLGGGMGGGMGGESVTQAFLHGLPGRGEGSTSFSEEGDASGNVRGSYGYRDAQGTLQDGGIHSGRDGFRGRHRPTNPEWTEKKIPPTSPWMSRNHLQVSREIHQTSRLCRKR
ncbi:WD repeat-containing protein 91 [Caerostris extrusa]|uniref:WD repeat-containing protein 91 n=1 Tax=Caerostris extrusa TaxID=172846 RepID=A0AAV4W6F4_CAEEX|nr:WD repeat-containing protein 91 [Caerostris extrusa]